MKLEIAQKSLATLLGNAYKAISNHPNIPIMSCFLFQADIKNQQVIVTGFNGNLGIKTHAACQILDGGTIAVNAELFHDVVASLHEQLVLEVTSNQLTITHSTGKCRLATATDPSEFPEMPTVVGKSTTLSVEVIKCAIASTLPFAARNELQQVLAAIHLKLSATIWETAATDGHRLGVACSHNGTEEFDSAATIPHATVTRLKEILVTTKGECQITIADESLISFQLANICVTSRLLDQQYPNYRSLIPTQFNYRFIVNKNILSSALNRVATLAGQKDRFVQITFSPGVATLYAEAPDLGGAVESVAVTSEDYDADFTIGFNIKYLSEAVRAIDSSEIVIKASAPGHPVILAPIENTNQFVLIMPVQLKQIKEFDVAPQINDEIPGSVIAA
ncbi:DNA polymerase III subunit beta [Chlorogloea sp. CCALA 695]|uniref:DNA polymerase III subunit beta n=1 Tax=Chlorogloea sp. CCALA 695 TaxID=2107693 RepID=UPI000D053D0F|nr:DNA polymerase III subunit beta [Chlorogloea sp. CCALA 695]PSB28522.1 DNA polymerase III subunit beta [Chlorogloea sp. CCALA 695]